MMQMNRAMPAGYVSKTPEIRFLFCGTPVANAVVGRASDTQVSGETREHTNSLSFYGKLADVALALEKGDNVCVGRIEQRQFIPRDGSKPRAVHEIVVSQRHMIAPARNANKVDSASKEDAAQWTAHCGRRR